MKHLLLLLGLSVFVVGVGVYSLALPEQARGKDCGGTPLTVLARGAAGPAAALDLRSECHESATDSAALGFSVIACGVVMGIGAVVLRET